MQHYQRDQAAGKNFTKRHSSLYIQAIEFQVRNRRQVGQLLAVTKLRMRDVAREVDFEASASALGTNEQLAHQGSRKVQCS
jgi:hypothetical protein